MVARCTAPVSRAPQMAKPARLAEPANSLDLSFFGRLELVFQEDGTIEVGLSGQAIFWTADETDAAMYGLEPGIYLVKGRIQAVVDESFIALEPAVVHGTITDLCALLA